MCEVSRVSVQKIGEHVQVIYSVYLHDIWGRSFSQAEHFVANEVNTDVSKFLTPTFEIIFSFEHP